MLNKVEQAHCKAYEFYDHLLIDLQNVQINQVDMKSALAGIEELDHLVAQHFLSLESRNQILKLTAVLNHNPTKFEIRSKELRENVSEVLQIVDKKYDDFLDLDISTVNDHDALSKVYEKIADSSERIENSREFFTTNYNDMSRVAFLVSGEEHQLVVKMDGDRIVGISD